MTDNLFYNFFLIYKILYRPKLSYKKVLSDLPLHIPSEKMEGCRFYVKKRVYIEYEVIETDDFFNTEEEAMSCANTHTLQKESNNAVVIKITPDGIKINICLLYCVPNRDDNGYTLVKYTD